MKQPDMYEMNSNDAVEYPPPTIAVRLSKRLTAAMVIEAGSCYMQQKFGHYEPAELLEALELAQEWVSDQIQRMKYPDKRI